MHQEQAQATKSCSSILRGLRLFPTASRCWSSVAASGRCVRCSLATIGTYVARIAFIAIRIRGHSAPRHPSQISCFQFSNGLFLQAELLEDALAALARTVVIVPCLVVDAFHTLVSFSLVCCFVPDPLRLACRLCPVLPSGQGKPYASLSQFFYGAFLQEVMRITRRGAGPYPLRRKVTDTAPPTTEGDRRRALVLGQAYRV